MFTPSPKMSSLFNDHVAKVHPDVELDPALCAHPCTLGHPPLDLDRERNISTTLENSTNIPSPMFFTDPAPVLFDLWFNELTENWASRRSCCPPRSSL